MELPKGIENILNRQFLIIGQGNFSFDDVTEDGLVEINKKMKNWYDIFYFKNFEQYLTWEKEARPIIEKKGYKFIDIDSIYGFPYKYEKLKAGDQLALL